MKSKMLKVGLVSTSLFIGNAIFTSNSVMAATHSVYSSYWNRTRTVIVKKKTIFKHFDELKHKYTSAQKF